MKRVHWIQLSLLGVTMTLAGTAEARPFF